MIPTIYPSIFLTLVFNEQLQCEYALTYNKLKDTYHRLQTISTKEVTNLLKYELTLEQLITKYYPETQI